MIQHEGSRHIDFWQMSISPRQTTANNCKTAFSLHVVESASNVYMVEMYNNVQLDNGQQRS